MVAAVAVLPLPFPVSASPPLRVGGALSPPADLLPAANLPGAYAVTSGGAVKVSMDYGVHRSRGMRVIQLPERLPQVHEEEECFFDVDRMSRRVSKIKAMLGSMGDGEISISAYDTAWVALVPDLHGNHNPQFPSSLQWIKENQLTDGSWGDRHIFIAYDRLLNTLACVVALRSWGICPDKCQRGITFLWENMDRLQDEDADRMPIGFEVAFPSLIEIARSLDLDVPYDALALRDIYAKRAFKLKRIPTDVMHEVPTTLLHSLEGMPGLDWKKLLRLQCADGSFLFSPASTAFALMQTRDSKSLSYLKKTTRRFNGGVPNVYPIDLFERIWAVDRLERLGISRYFEEEIEQCLDYVYEHWKKDGISWASNSRVQDIDDTSMGFRLLRLHGYNVSSDVFRHFEEGGEFFCFAGQSNQAITGIYNLNRASQVSFPREKILEEARTFSHGFLRDKQAHNKLSDKWIITKDLPGEVGYTLDFPWYASLPRVETRLYLDQYGGDRDVWIGKTLYRMPYVNNDDYLELAKSDYNQCQALHQLELLGLQRWYAECGLDWYGVSRRSLLRSYFLAAASIFEPERAAERLGWAQTTVLAEAVSAHLRGSSGGEGGACILNEMKQALCTQDDSATTVASARMLSSTTVPSGDGERMNGPPRVGRKRTGMGFVGVLLHTLDRLTLDATASLPPGCAHAAATQRQICRHLRCAWGDWLLSWREEEDEHSHVRWWWPGGAENSETGLLLVRSLELCVGRTGLEESLQGDAPQRAHDQYPQSMRIFSRLCRKLRHLHQRNLLMADGDKNNSSGQGTDVGDVVSSQGMEPDMQELLLCVLGDPSGDSRGTLQTFLTVAKSFYYVANCPASTLEHHIAKVLFEETV